MAPFTLASKSHLPQAHTALLATTLVISPPSREEMWFFPGIPTEKFKGLLGEASHRSARWAWGQYLHPRTPKWARAHLSELLYKWKQPKGQLSCKTRGLFWVRPVCFELDTEP